MYDGWLYKLSEFGAASGESGLAGFARLEGV
jgi:hypothetical protein